VAKKGKKEEEAGPKTIQNRRARFDYELIDTYEAGIVLVGSEVKSVYKGRANLSDAYCQVVNGELWIRNLDIEPYEHSSAYQPDRRRDRKLLLHRREIDVIQRRSQEKGLAIVVTKMYFNHGRVKLEIALGRGKREYDKREHIAKRETQRELEQARGSRRH
jgi:SsrA-binding protein